MIKNEEALDNLSIGMLKKYHEKSVNKKKVFKKICKIMNYIKYNNKM